jgi:hypothetical protein
MEEDQHEEDQAHTAERRECAPMCRHKEQHSRTEEDGAEDERQQDLPLPSAGPELRAFIAANRSCRGFVEQARALPTCQIAFGRVHVEWK